MSVVEGVEGIKNAERVVRVVEGVLLNYHPVYLIKQALYSCFVASWVDFGLPIHMPLVF